MAEKTLIAWADSTFNAWMGCQKVSPGCKHCYAETLTSGKMGLDVFGAKHKRQRTSRSTWAKPRKWNREAQVMGVPRRVFTNSLADVFEDAEGPNLWREDLWELVRATPWLDWLILTKRPENLPAMLPDDWDNSWPNVWLGTSIESNKFAERATILTEVPAFVHFISYEPALGPGDEIPLDGIDWLICGGESGPGFRKMDIRWAYQIWDRCKKADVPFFFKQNHGIRTEMGIDALGKVVREFPPTWDRGVRARTTALF